MSKKELKYLKPFVDDVTIYLYYDFEPEKLLLSLNTKSDDSDEFNSLSSLILSIPDIKYTRPDKDLDYSKLKIKGTIYLNYYQKEYYHNESIINVSYNLQKYNMIKLKQSLKMTIHKTPNDKLKKLKEKHNIDDTIFTNKHERQLFVWKHFFYQSETFQNILNKMYNKLSNSFRFAHIDDKFTPRLKNDTEPLKTVIIYKKKIDKKDKDYVQKQKLEQYLVAQNPKDKTMDINNYGTIIDHIKNNFKTIVDQDIINKLKSFINNNTDNVKMQKMLDDTFPAFKNTESRFIPSTARNENQPSSPTTWQWSVKSDICSIIDNIKEKIDIKKPVAWKIGTEGEKKTYLRVKDIKERMLRIPLLGNPTNCRLNPTNLDEKKINTFCCLLMLSVSYSVPMIRAVNWEIVNKTWMMMLHQYKNIINEDGFWLVDIPEETKTKLTQKKLDAIKKLQGQLKNENEKEIKEAIKKEKEDLQVTFHGGRLLELVVRIYNLRITQDDDKGLKLFKPGVNNYRTYLEKYFEKMQPFMTPLEVQDNDTIADVIIKEAWVHPKSLIDDVVEPFCKNMSVLLGFNDNPKIVYNDYFD